MATNPLTPLAYSVSAHPLTLGAIGATGPEGSTTVTKGATGLSGATGSVGLSGATGITGPYPIGVTYSSGTGGDPLGGLPHHLIVRYSDGSTYDAGYFRGATGTSEHWVAGEDIGSTPRTGHPSTGGHWVHQFDNGHLVLKGITGGNGVKVIDNGDSIRIAYETFDAVQVVGGEVGQLGFLNQDSAGGTGISGATYTHYYPGPTFSLDFTTIGHSEVVGRIRPHKFDCETYTFIYKINPNDLLTFKSAKNQTSTGMTIIIDTVKDYEDWFADPQPADDYTKIPYYKIVDSSQPSDDDYSFFFGEKTSCSFTLSIRGLNYDTTKIAIPPCEHIGYITSNPHETFPSNWKFPNNANPRQTGGIDIIQFITIGDKDVYTNKTEWYGLYVSSHENPFI